MGRPRPAGPARLLLAGTATVATLGITLQLADDDLARATDPPSRTGGTRTEIVVLSRPERRDGSAAGSASGIDDATAPTGTASGPTAAAPSTALPTPSTDPTEPTTDAPPTAEAPPAEAPPAEAPPAEEPPPSDGKTRGS